MDIGQLDDIESVVNRLKRAQGQIGGVLRMIEDGRECGDVITQLSAVHRAVGRAGFDIIASGMSTCLSDPDGPREVDMAELRRLFMSLA